MFAMVRFYKFWKLYQLSQKNIQGTFCEKTEATTGDVQWKQILLKISQISLENTCVGVSF